MLYSSQGTIRFPIAVGQTLIVQNISGVETVSGSSASREDASARFGSGYFVYGPQSSAGTIQLSTTGQLDYQLVVGDATPWNNFIPLSGSSSGVSAGGDLAAGSAAVAAALGKSLYLGLVASRTGASGAFTGANKNWKMSTLHTANVPIAAIKVRDSNWWLSNGVETATGSTMQVKRWVEYPIGSTPQPLLYGGAAVGTCLSGSDIETDLTTLSTTIPQGADFLLHQFGATNNGFAYVDSQSGAATISGGSSYFPYNGERFGIAADATIWSTGSITNEPCAAGADTLGTASYTLMVRPAAIIGYTTRPSFAILGNSRDAGVKDTVSQRIGLIGHTERGIAKRFATTNQSGSGAQIAQLATLSNWTKRKAIIDAYCTHVILMDPINDFVSAATATAVITNVKTIIAALNKPTWLLTCAPKTTGTFADDAGQTIDATSNTERTNWNNYVRYGIKESAGTIDIARVLESTTTAGKWAANLTSDGLHANKAGNEAVERSGEFDQFTFMQF